MPATATAATASYKYKELVLVVVEYRIVICGSTVSIMAGGVCCSSYHHDIRFMIYDHNDSYIMILDISGMKI